MRDPRSGRVFASVTSPFYGPKLWYFDEPATSGCRPRASSCRSGGDDALERIWTIVPGDDERTVYVGGDPGVLFESRDGGATFELNRALCEHPTRDAVAAGRGRAVPALDRAVAGRAGPARGRASRPPACG